MVSREQRINSPYSTNEYILLEASEVINVALPVIVDSFDPEKMTVECHSAIRVKLVNKAEGTVEDHELPQFVDVAVMLPMVNDYMITLPIKEGDTGVAFFMDLCYDGWWDTGEISNQLILRQHDYSDAMFYPGVRARVDVIEDYSTDSIQIRNKDGNTYYEVKETDLNMVADNDINHEAENDINSEAGNDINMEAGSTVNITAETAVNITSPLNTINGDTIINGNLTVNGDLTVTGTTTTNIAIIGGINFASHTHSCPEGGQTGPPQ